MAQQHLALRFDTREMQEAMQRFSTQVERAVQRVLAGKRALSRAEIQHRCTAIADQVEPGYRGGQPRSCTGHYAKRGGKCYCGRMTDLSLAS